MRCVFTAVLAGIATLATSVAAAETVRGYADSRVGQLHYRATGLGEAHAEAALVLLHLVPNSSQVFEEFIPAVGGDRAVVAFDLPGFGMSDPVDGDDTIEAYAAAVLDAVDALQLGDVDLLGYHTGAAVAAEITRRRPSKSRRLVLVAIPVLTAEERAGFAALPPIAFDEDGEFAKQEWRRSMQWRGPGQTIDSVRRTYAEKMRPGARERGASAVVSYDLAAVLETLSEPVLVIRPKDDLWQATLRARSLLPDAQWVDLPQYGHGLFHVAPDELARLVGGFLQSPPKRQ